MDRIDQLDARILRALDDDPAATTVALSATLGVARNTVTARLARLQRDGVLATPGARVDPRALGYDLVAFVEVVVSQGNAQPALTELARIPEVIEINATSGRADALVRVVARDTADLYRVTNAMLETPGVLRSSTAIVLTEALPLRVAPLLDRRASGEG
ncbi:Lrp/AsnC family transcriptional regulator [Schumannella soli]|uniref:Lrp/AsnC family transcriptional regulator n=1 Tax=Schumannella soli TaxID=2590779 RepID=A0A506XWH6_9MICO|nr:Lrp/AsnC family transcriptional regulator [Schumannella soli]TPW74165.1 Lrp/AsnC family transcriptional regulator [Schumannella soli]